MSRESSEEIERKKLLWRCRRGTKELDLILNKFVTENFADLTRSEKEDFNLLLETQDPVLTEWLCFDGEPSSDLNAIVTTIRLCGKE